MLDGSLVLERDAYSVVEDGRTEVVGKVSLGFRKLCAGRASVKSYWTFFIQP